MTLTEFLSEAVAKGHRQKGKYGEVSIGMSVATLAKMVEKSNIEQIDERPYDAVRDSGDGKQQAIFCIPSGTYTGTHQIVWLLPGDQTGYNISFKDGLLTGIIKQVYKKNDPVLNVVEDDASILLSEINSKFF